MKGVVEPERRLFFFVLRWTVIVDESVREVDLEWERREDSEERWGRRDIISTRREV